ncbi:MAG: acyl-[acyl-carrier-protein] thioesterase [Leptospira sp.]|nr:acyl-[acyl-carrier-protein] thioesterase [Leptospira sp.]
MTDLTKPYTNHYVTRIGDIDYNQHVNGSRYEFFAEDARMQILSILGIDIKKLIKNQIALVHKFSHFQFQKQRNWNDILKLETTCFLNHDEMLEWNHAIFDMESGELAAKLIRKDSLEQFDTKDKELILYYVQRSSHNHSMTEEQIPKIESKILEFSLRPNLSDRNGFNHYPLHQLFKLVEEVRWLFSEGMGLTLEGAKELDCIFFTTESQLSQSLQMRPGHPIQVKAFISDFKKISCTLQQLFFQENDMRPFLTVKETMLAVSPSKMSPRKIPDELFSRFLNSP